MKKFEAGRVGGATGFAVVSAVVLVMCWTLVVYDINAVGGTHILRVLFNLGCDAALVLLPYWLLSGRFRWTLLIGVWLNSLLLMCSVWYCRFWGKMAGLDALVTLGNVNGLLLNSVPGVWKVTDLLYIFLPGAAQIFYLCFRKNIRAEVYPTRLKILLCVLSLILFIAGQISRSVSNKHYLQSIDRYNGESIARITADRFDSFTDNNSYLINNGPILLLYRSFANLYVFINNKVELTPEESERVERFIAATPRMPADGVDSLNSRKNVILILVESLNANAILATSGGRDVAPVMKGLVCDSLNFSALDVITQIRSGGSGDGQLIINTGLFPTSLFSTSMVYGGKVSFPSLAKSLGRRENVVVFADDGISWNEIISFKNYGFEKVVTNRDYLELVKRYGGDGAMFAMADSVIADMKQPFFLELLTVTMHTPFSLADVPERRKYEWISRPEYPAVKNDYLRTVAYFDECLGRFIENLKERGLWDDTILILVSDHSQDFAEGNPALSLTDVPMAFIATNCGVGGRVDRTVGQIDIFPTILQFTGSGPRSAWRGVGTPMTDPSLRGALLQDESVRGETPDSATLRRMIDAYDISNLIIRSDYFSGK